MEPAGPDPLRAATAIAEATGGAHIATCGEFPHIATVSRLAVTDEGALAVSEFFCPTTVENLDRNPRVAIVVHDPARDEGYQIVGSVRDVRELAVLDGVTEGEVRRVPQVERELTVVVERVSRFGGGPHTDEPIA